MSRRPFRVATDGGDTYLADTVIIATGAQAKWLGLDSERAFMGAGVSGCAVCDGAFFRNKQVVVVGGGNTAVEDALYLTHHASRVTLVHRRDHLRAEKILQTRLFKHPKVEVLWNHAVDEILGEGTPAARHRRAAARHRHGRALDARAPTASSWRSAIRPPRRCSAARCRWTARATS